MKLHHVAVVCSSLKNADRFYGEILGLQQIDADLECQFILYENENFTIEVFIIPAAQQKITPIAHLCLEVDNKEKFAKNCQANGLVVKKIPRGNSLLIFVKDYDGNLFEIKELQGCK
ncbi:MAG: hypothetical protein B1H13_11080 [Desulfobacteraceae bacterium 4484_190.3]|nr:MAG: hypothetical protein B1H13_11080 [Desulfobacteraceae bacterium 4484_190.3]